MREFVRHNLLFYGLYIVFLGWAGYYLLNFDKVSLHRKINALVGNPFIDNFFKYITHLGDGVFAIVFGILILVFNMRNGIYVLLSYIVSGTISSLLKNYMFGHVNRPHWVLDEILHEKYNRVPGVDVFIHNSFPSGHSTSAFAVFTALALVTENKLLKVLCLAIAVSAAFSRTYISQHWLVDIYFGSLLGVGTATLLYAALVKPGSELAGKLNKPLFGKA